MRLRAEWPAHRKRSMYTVPMRGVRRHGPRAADGWSSRTQHNPRRFERAGRDDGHRRLPGAAFRADRSLNRWPTSWQANELFVEGSGSSRARRRQTGHSSQRGARRATRRPTLVLGHHRPTWPLENTHSAPGPDSRRVRRALAARLLGRRSQDRRVRCLPDPRRWARPSRAGRWATSQTSKRPTKEMAPAPRTREPRAVRLRGREIGRRSSRRAAPVSGSPVSADSGASVSLLSGSALHAKRLARPSGPRGARLPEMRVPRPRERSPCRRRRRDPPRRWPALQGRPTPRSEPQPREALHSYVADSSASQGSRLSASGDALGPQMGAELRIVPHQKSGAGGTRLT